MAKHDCEARSRKFRCQSLFRYGVWSKSAVAFIKISGRTHTTDLHRLSPRSCREIFLRFDCLRFRFSRSRDLIAASHCFGQNSTVHFLRRFCFHKRLNFSELADKSPETIVPLTVTKIPALPTPGRITRPTGGGVRGLSTSVFTPH